MNYLNLAKMHQLAQSFSVGGCPPPYIPNRIPTLNAHYQWRIFGSKLLGEYVPVQTSVFFRSYEYLYF